MGISSDREFLAVARKRLGELFPQPAPPARLPQAPASADRDDRVADRRLRRRLPRSLRPVVLLDSTPVECGRSVETVRRSELADACGYGYCRSHSRWFWGMRLHLCCAPDGTPRASILAPADQPEREVALRLLPTPSTAASRSSATRATPAASSPPRSRPGSPPRFYGPTARTSRKGTRSTSIDPPADRVGLLDAEGPSRPRAPPRPHPRRPTGADRRKAPGARRRRLGQQPGRTAEPLLRSVRRLSVESII